MFNKCSKKKKDDGLFFVSSNQNFTFEIVTAFFSLKKLRPVHSRNKNIYFFLYYFHVFSLRVDGQVFIFSFLIHSFSIQIMRQVSDLIR